MRRKLRKILAVFLTVVTVFGNMGMTTSAEEEYAEEEIVSLNENGAVSSDRNTYSGTSRNDVGTTGKVYTPSYTLAATEKYRSMDYTFLQDYSFGSSYDSDVFFVFTNVDAMVNSDLKNMKDGAIVKTKGYYNSGDFGGATYQISKYKKQGGIELSNGLYANLLPDIYTDSEGKKWYVANAKQFGAKGDGINPEHDTIYFTYSRINECVAENADVERGIAYIPAGEYKCDDQLHVAINNVNVVGDGEDTVLFTDNDYRKEAGYSEHFFQVWGSNNSFFGHFVLQAREVDLYHYMRQFSLIYCSDICVYDVDLLIPKECYNNYYYEDKQYSNFCCYTGNTNITVDGCKMEQMTGTYRGANIGVLDIWSAGETNITIMNCDLYGNARDEQIGFFGTSNPNSHVNNVEFINNTVHAYQPEYINIVKNATMRFTIAYSDSNDVSNIHIAGNHFIVECDSKFITFGKVKNCVIEDNIIEQYSTYSTWSIIFESNTYVAEEDVVIKHNDIFVTSNEGKGKGNLLAGNSTFDSNRVFCDQPLVFGLLGSTVTNNEVISLATLGRFSTGHTVTGNTIYVYNGFGTCGGSSNRQAEVIGGDENLTYNFSNNTIYNYEWADTTGNFQSLFTLNAGAKKVIVNNNRYYAPNVRYTKAANYASSYKNPDDKLFYLKLWRNNGGVFDIELKNNSFQGVVFDPMYPYNSETVVDASGNVTLPQADSLSEKTVSQVDIINNGEVVTEITTTASTIDFDDIEYVDIVDEEGNITGKQRVADVDVKWYTSIEEIAEVSKDGVVTRKAYGDVAVYCVPLNGGGKYGKCILHFSKEKATSITPQYTSKELQVGRRDYIQCEVSPSTASQELIYESSNPDVVTVSKIGRIEAKALGEADITCSTTDGSGVKTVIHITVTDVTVKRISVYASSGSVELGKIGATVQLKAYYTPSDAVNTGISKWESTNTSIAKVSNTGLVTAVGGGVCNIKAYSMDGSVYGTIAVYVKPEKVLNLKVSSVGKDSVTLSWEKGGENYGYYIYKWDDATSQWTAVSDKYTTNTSYTVTGLEAGKSYKFCVRAFISRWFSNGTRKVFESDDVVVSATTYDFNPVTDIWASADHLTFTEGDPVYNANISINVKNSNADNKELDIYVEDESVATITKSTYNSTNYKYSLFVVPVGAGYTNLVIKAKDGSGITTKVPIGVFKKCSIANASGTTEYGKITITFDKIDDESLIDGYVIRRIRGYSNVDPIYIPKDGSDEYTCVISDGLVDGQTYGYRIYAYNLKDNIYYERHKKNVYDLVMPEKIPVTGINTSQTAYSIKRGTSSNIYATVSPSNASVSTLDWQITDTDVADIEILKDTSGQEYAKVTGKKNGQTTLTLMSRDGENIIRRINIAVYDSEEETTTVKEETTTVKDETTTVKEETTTVKEETTTVQRETTTVKEETTTVQEETAPVQEESSLLGVVINDADIPASDGRTPQTGDNTTMWVFLLLAVLVAGAIVVVNAKKEED